MSVTNSDCFDLLRVISCEYFDNFEFKDFLSNPVSGGLQSLVHPHIWVSDSDKQIILDNIAQYDWASSMFDQLVSRQAALKSIHPSNPSFIISRIPEIPGHRNVHRGRLNTAAESSFLYYLTGDEQYAQLSADILYQYVKMLSVQDVSFKFYFTIYSEKIPSKTVLEC